MSEAKYSACPECWRKAAPSKRGGMPQSYRATRACAFCKPGISTGLTVIATVPTSHAFEKNEAPVHKYDTSSYTPPSTDSTVEIACDIISSIVESAFDSGPSDTGGGFDGGGGGDFGGGGAGGDF